MRNALYGVYKIIPSPRSPVLPVLKPLLYSCLNSCLSTLQQQLHIHHIEIAVEFVADFAEVRDGHEAEQFVKPDAPLVFSSYTGNQGMISTPTALIYERKHKPPAQAMRCVPLPKIYCGLKRIAIGREFFPRMNVAISQNLTIFRFGDNKRTCGRNLIHTLPHFIHVRRLLLECDGGMPDVMAINLCYCKDILRSYRPKDASFIF